jgi:hypothetical protein
MPVVNICSTIRQNAEYAQSFVAQLEALSTRNFTLGTIHLVCDGARTIVDEHLAAFARRRPQVRLVQEEAAEGFTFSLDRKAEQWSRIANQAVCAALEAPCSHVLYIEADLCFPFDLVDQLVARDKDVIAPLVLLGGAFYDSWGFRDLAGRKVTGVGGVDVTSEPVELGSVGSCALIRAEALRRGARFPPTYDDGLFVGLCAQARALGYQVWADPAVSILHPTSSWRRQSWLVQEVRVLLPDAPAHVVPVGRAVAGLYDRFVRDFLPSLQGALQGMPSGLYVLTIRYDRQTRRQIWTFLLQQADPSSPLVRVADQVYLQDASEPGAMRTGDLAGAARA